MSERVSDVEYKERGYTPDEIAYDKKRKELDKLKGRAYVKEKRGYQLPPFEPRNWKNPKKPFYFGLVKHKLEPIKKRESQKVYTTSWWRELNRIVGISKEDDEVLKMYGEYREIDVPEDDSWEDLEDPILIMEEDDER